MTTKQEREALNVTPPLTGATIAVPSNASTTAGVAGQNLSAYEGKWLAFKADRKTHVAFGTSPTAAGTATTSDWYLTADTPEVYRIPEDGSCSGLRAYGNGGTATIFYRVVSRPV